MKSVNRRRILPCSAAAMGFPWIVLASVLGAHVPRNRITLASIGTGGQGRSNTICSCGNRIARLLPYVMWTGQNY